MHSRDTDLDCTCKGYLVPVKEVDLAGIILHARVCVMAVLNSALHASGLALGAVQAVKLRVSHTSVLPWQCSICVTAAEFVLHASCWHVAPVTPIVI